MNATSKECFLAAGPFSEAVCNGDIGPFSEIGSSVSRACREAICRIARKGLFEKGELAGRKFTCLGLPEIPVVHHAPGSFEHY